MPGLNNALYLQISAAEIADDYPAPSEYVKLDDETDEVMIWQEDMSYYTNQYHLLKNFSIYNAEVCEFSQTNIFQRES